ncbi:BamA/OMP85 family outer membrane protein [Rhodopirellula sallentina]|uniref:Outer membrane protein assembly complex, YaeT protein n=1 Tax=Rhodopirellula sallentina SM41 TaxID=1263870 RepID=M5U827_9BACT|nr:POTRA domain-containing protein [Rhodopirellula sallentina]EMI57429.1 outer membrane protein assembly complex, YaeT protein [Rhodopirellula sallentina SM41]
MLSPVAFPPSPPTTNTTSTTRTFSNRRYAAKVYGVAESIAKYLAVLVFLCSPVAFAQMGGGGMGGGGAQAPQAEAKTKFRDHIHARAGMTFRRERGDAVVASVRIVGNRSVPAADIFSELQTRKGRFYDSETVLADVRRLNDMGSFDQVTFEVKPLAANPPANPQSGSSKLTPSVVVTFYVHERPMVAKVIFHGNRALNDREIAGRAGVSAGDPLSEFSVESGRRRLLDYYHEEGFNQAAVSATITGSDGGASAGVSATDLPPGTVIFRINEGPLERIADIQIEGSTIVTEARLKKIIRSRGPMAGFLSYVGNKANMRMIDEDVNLLSSYYHTLGFLTATVGRRFEYDETGKWVTVVFVVKEGPRFTVGDVQIVGNEFITEESLRARLELHAGDMFDGTIMRRDVGEIVYGYGELGFIYAEVKPKTIMRDENGVADIVYEITEGDRWKVGRILVNIDGEPHLMRETTMLNLVDMREGDWIDRRTLEMSRRRIERSQLLETNPAIAEAPDIKVVPKEDALR